MTTRDGKTPTPAWLIERLAQGELDAATAASVRQRLADEGRSPEAEIAALATSNREILQAHPADKVAAAVRGRAPRRARASWLLAGLPLMAGAAAALLVMARPVQTTGPGATGAAPE